MKRLAILLSGATLLLAPASFASAETRCGWLENPTPGNWWLIDKDDTWTIMEQGGHEPEGMDMIGDISARDYVNTNGNYGYACACLDVMTDSNRITMIHSFKQLRLSKCQNDKALPPPPGE
jgi:hypothetical protein